ncbi:MAG TPA: hypothetical protein ENO22_02610 [candidate division Zixibacteria bacterium]|nr:hypothetical protein [candidate division Zixibacteria bacterium]
MAIPSILIAQDTTAFINANRISMFAGNDGILANDFFREIEEDYAGFYYRADTTQPVIWSSALWIAGKVGGGIRTGMAYYSAGRTYTEFAPGPYESAITDSSRFKVYKISRDDLISPGDDWMNWPVDLGAPLDSLGNPLLIGEQTLFSVYNDADTSRRDYSAGSEDPLRAEVRQMVWAYDREKYLGDVVFVDFEVINRSDDVWDSIFVGLHADPDLGDPRNDLVGSYEPGSMVYQYSEKLDMELEGFGHAVAGVILLGARSSNDDYDPYTATHTNPTPFYPTTPQESFNFLQGLDSTGSQYIDPTTSEPTRFIYNGDPRYNVGWLDQMPEDRKMLISHGPFRVFPGDSLTISIAFVAQTSSDRKTAFDNLFELSEKVIDWHNHGAAGFEIISGSSSGLIRNVEFSPDYQNWMEPLTFSGDYAGIGIGKASEFYGSAVEDSNLYSVELRFSYDSTQKVHYYSHLSERWEYQGFLDLPVRAVAVDDSSQLDLIYLSGDGDECHNCFINPRGSPESRYSLIITGSNYTGGENDNYILENPLQELGGLDLLYLIRFKPKQKSLVYNVQEGQRLIIDYTAEAGNPPPANLRFGLATVSTQKHQPAFIQSNYKSPVSFRTELSNPLDFSFQSVEYTLEGGIQEPVYMAFHPETLGLKESRIRFYNTDFEEYYDSINVSGRAVMWLLDGDINLNGWLEPSDIASYVGYLYRDYPLPDIEIELDLDGSGKVDLADIVTLINILFISPNL